MTRAQYHYGHLRERRKGVIARARLVYVFYELRNLGFVDAWRSITSGFCLIKKMTKEEYDASAFAFFKHQKIYNRFKRMTGKELFTLIPMTEA